MDLISHHLTFFFLFPVAQDRGLYMSMAMEQRRVSPNEMEFRDDSNIQIGPIKTFPVLYKT